MTKVLVPWTGGVDSTLTLLQQLKEHSQYDVRTVTFIPDQIAKRQRESEAEARKRITEDFRKRGFRWSHTDMELGGYSVSHSYCPQPMMWVGLVAPVVNHNEKVMFSWLRTDYSPDLICAARDAFKALVKIGHGDDNMPTFHIPQIEWTKGEVQQMAADNKFLSLCSYCEDPNEDLTPCGRCKCCQSYKTGEYERKLKKRVHKTLFEPISDKTSIIDLAKTTAQTLKDL